MDWISTKIYVQSIINHNIDDMKMIYKKMEIKDQRSRSFLKIIGNELDHQKDQDQLGDL